MMGRASIGVDDDLAAGQASIGGRSSEDERTGRIHQHAVFVMSHLVAKHVIEHGLDHMLHKMLLQPCLIHFRIMLGGDQHSIQTYRPIMLVVFDGDLSLAVRTQMSDLAALAHLGKTVGKTMGKMNRQRHQYIGLVARVAEHHTLVAGTLRLVPLLAAGLRLLFLAQTVHALIDFGALTGQRHHHAAGIRVKTDAGARVADVANHGTHDVLDIAIAFAGHLAEHEELPSGGAGLHRHVGMRVLREHIVENRVGNLVADLIRMAFRHRFGGNQLQFSHTAAPFTNAQPFVSHDRPRKTPRPSQTQSIAYYPTIQSAPLRYRSV